MEDRQLIQQFARMHSQEAFAELVQRHRNWVYSACLRRLRDPGAAEDATQAVFITLAQKAQGLTNVKALSPWLHQAVKFICANSARARQRRQRHETEAAAMCAIQTSAPDKDSHWQEIESELEPALDRLGSRDRQTILLRFYEQKSHAQIAAALQISEPAAHKRLSRALGRLRSILVSAGGFTLSAAAVDGLLSTHAVGTAPVSLTASLPGLSAAAMSAKVAPLTKGIGYMFAMTKLKTAASIAAVVTILAAPASLLVVKSLAASPSAQATTPASATVTPSSSPIDPIVAMNEALIKGDAATYAAVHAPGHPEEEAHGAAMEALLGSKLKLLTAYNASIDPDGKTPLPDGLLIGQFMDQQTAKEVAVTPIDDNNASVKVPGVLTYRVTRQKEGAPWKIQTGPSLASKYPSDTNKAIATFAKMFSQMNDAYDSTADEILMGTLKTPPEVLTALRSRLANISKVLEGLPPPVIEFPIHIATRNFLPAQPSKDYAFALDEQVKRSPDSPPAGRIESISSRPKNNPRLAGWRTYAVALTDVQAIRGKRVRVSASIKTEGAANWGGLSLNVTGDDNKVYVVADNVEKPVHGTTDWTQSAVVADIPEGATTMYLSYMLWGTGRLWADDFQIDVVNTDTPVNDDQGWQKWSYISPQYNFGLDPKVLHDGRPAMCISSDTAPATAWCSYGKNDRYPERYRGKKARMTAWIKTEGLTGQSGIWLRSVVGNNAEHLQLKENRKLIGTKDWQQVSVVIDVPPVTQCLSSSIIMFGKGKLWVDLESVKYEVVDDSSSDNL